jgi:hypothetical protein
VNFVTPPITAERYKQAKGITIYYGNREVLAVWRRSLGKGAVVGIPKSQIHLVNGLLDNDSSFQITPFDKLSPEDQKKRFEGFLRLHMDKVHEIESLVKTGAAKLTIDPSRISLDSPETIENMNNMTEARKNELYEKGNTILLEGKVGRLTLAAGAASRFRPDPGDTRPKALFEITDQGKYKEETYLSVQARDILRMQVKYGTTVPWGIFVHPTARKNFEEYLQKCEYFGLRPDQIALVEHTGEVPYFTLDGRIAVDKDALYKKGGKEERERGTKEDILFGTEGHGYFAYAFRHNPIYMAGARANITIYDLFKEKGIQTAFISNIDNLGALIGTKEYPIILGRHSETAKTSGVGMTVELVPPLIVYDHNVNKQKLWDEGGVALKVDHIPQILDTNVLNGEALKRVRDPQNPFPFNTANATFEICSIGERVNLPPTLQERLGLYLYEKNFWNITGLINTAFIIVPSQIPPAFADPDAITGTVSLDPNELPISRRFIPTKKWEHRYWSAGLYELVMRGYDSEPVQP